MEPCGTPVIMEPCGTPIMCCNSEFAEFEEKVLSMLEELRISSDGFRFQCYDTTSSISGQYNGAQVKLSKFLGRSIPYIICMGHKANLCIEHSSKESRMIEFFFQHSSKLVQFLNQNYKLIQYLHRVSQRITRRSYYEEPIREQMDWSRIIFYSSLEQL